MRQSIVTTFYGPTNTRGSRVKATSDAGSVWMNWKHELNCSENHQQSDLALAKKLGWRGTWVGGSLPKNAGYAFCMHQFHCERPDGEIHKDYCDGWFTLA